MKVTSNQSLLEQRRKLAIRQANHARTGVFQGGPGSVAENVIQGAVRVGARRRRHRHGDLGRGA
jgi:hypothetical protein